MLKKDLIKEAQKHCDSSFTSTDPNNHYSAWSSMSSLIKKNLVFKENKLPARYKLTEEGRSIAQTILHGTNENTENFEDNSSPSPKSLSVSMKNKLAIENHDESGQDSLPVYEKIEKSALRPEKIKTTKNPKNDVIEILSDSDCDSDIITIDDEKPKEISSIPKSFKLKSKESKKQFIPSDSDSDSLPDINFNTKSDSYKETSVKPVSKAKNISSSSSNSRQQQQPTNLISNNSSQHEPSSLDLGSRQTNYSENFSHKAFLKKTDIHAPTAMYAFEPGSFDVMLYVDNCEQSHA